MHLDRETARAGGFFIRHQIRPVLRLRRFSLEPYLLRNHLSLLPTSKVDMSTVAVHAELIETETDCKRLTLLVP